jgi:hypothetical protein
MGNNAVLHPAERKVIVCALDETLADHAGNPILTTIQMVGDLVEARPGNELWVLTDKAEALREDVTMWLNTHVDYYHRVLMRPRGNYSNAEDLALLRLSSAHILPKHVFCAVDSREAPLAIFRRYGVTTFLARQPDPSWRPS